MKKLIFLIVAFAALASPAHAGFVPAAVAWVSSTFAITAATATAALNFVGSLALSAISQAYQKRKMGRMGGANVTFEVQMGDDLPLSFVVGEYATAGKRKYIGSWGKNTRFITEVVEVSALPVPGLQAIWVNDELGEWASENVWGINPADSTDNFSDQGEYAPGTLPAEWITAGRPLSNLSDDGNRIYVKFVDGTQTTADPFLTQVFGDDPDYPWTSDMIGRGKAYVIITTRYDSDTLTQYPTYLFETEPLPMYDWRYDSTNGGIGAQRWGDRSTYQPTRNPAVISYNIARGIYYGGEWVFGGKDLAAWRLPLAEWTAAANACDQPVTLAGGGTEPRYRCGMEISADMEPASVLEEIGAAANMLFAEVGGRLKPIVDLPGASVFSFTDDDILITEGQSFSPFYPASETYNAINAVYPERGEKWTNKDAPEYVDTAARESDKGEHLPASVTYGAAPYARQVQRLMRSQMRDYRRMRQHQHYLPPDAYPLEPGIDLVSWTSARNGYINKQFKLERVGKTPGMNVLVRLREVDPSDYDWSSNFQRPVVITAPVNPRPFVQPISGLTVTGTVIPDGGGNARRPAILVACDGDETGVTHIQIEARRAGSAEVVIDTERAFREPFAWYLQKVLPQTDYQVRARLTSDLTPRSEWSAWLSVTTPDVRLGSLDLRMTEITQEVIADIEALEEWIKGDDPILIDLREDVDAARGELGDTGRLLRDELEAIRDGSVESSFGALLDRQSIRTQLAVEVGTARASFEDQIDLVVREQAAIATRVTTLRADFNSSSAIFNDTIIALASDQLAAVTRITTLEADLGETNAQVIEESLARADGDSALAAQIVTLTATVGDNTAEITNEKLARADGDSALAAQIDTLTATVGDNTASITNESIARANADDAISDSLAVVSARTDRASAEGRIRMTSLATGTGALSRIGIAAEATADGTTQTAGMFMEARTDGINQILFRADRLAITTGTGANRRVPFIVDGGIVFIDEAFIRDATISRAKIENAAINSAKIEDLSVQRINISGSAVTTFERAYTSGDMSFPLGTDWTQIQSISYTIGRAGSQIIHIAFTATGAASTVGKEIRLYRTQGGTDTIVYRGKFSSNLNGEDVNIAIADTGTLSGAITYGLSLRNIDGSPTTISSRFLGVLNAHK